MDEEPLLDEPGPVATARAPQAELLGPITEGAYLPQTEREKVELRSLMSRALDISRTERFMRVSGLTNNGAALRLFDQLLRNARPALSHTGGAVGLLSIDKGPPTLTLALAQRSKDFAIRHELYHLAREARSVTERNVSLFEREKSGSWLARLGLMLKEESIVWVQTLR